MLSSGVRPQVVGKVGSAEVRGKHLLTDGGQKSGPTEELHCKRSCPSRGLHLAGLTFSSGLPEGESARLGKLGAGRVSPPDIQKQKNPLNRKL